MKQTAGKRREPGDGPEKRRRLGASAGRVLASVLAPVVLFGWGPMASRGEAEAPSPKGASSPELADLSLDDLVNAKVERVYAASKREQQTVEAPASVSILTREGFLRQGYRTLGEAVRSVRGFYGSEDRSYSFVGLRGVSRPGDYGGGTLMMIGGHRLNDPVTDQAFNGSEFPLDVDLIDRVEIVRGPGSALYGNNAFFSVIDVIPRRGRDVGMEASATAGSLDTYSGRVSLGHSFTNGVELLVSGTLYESAGHDRLYYPEFRSTNGGWAEHLDDERRGSLYVSASYGDFTVDGGYLRRSKSMPTAAYETLFDVAPNELLDERAWGDLKYRHVTSGDWELRGRLYFDQYYYDGYAPQDGIEAGLGRPVVFNHDTYLTRWWGGDVQMGKTLWERHEVTLGMEGRHDVQVDQHNYFVDPYQDVNLVRGSGYDVGVFAQDEFAIGRDLRLTGGVRYDSYSSFGDTVNPKAALVYRAAEGTVFKLLYGHAYRAPNGFETDYQAVGYVGNHGLRPETIRSHELVWEQRFAGPLRLTSSVFYNLVEDLITQVDETADPAVGGWIFRNRGDASILGGDVELAAEWENGIRGKASYTYADARDTVTDERLSNAPEHVVTVGLSVPVYRRKVFLSADSHWVGRRRSATTSDYTGDYGVVNVTLFGRELVKGVEVSATAYNLLDCRYSDVAGPDFAQQFIEQDGRGFRVKLTYRY